MKQLLSILFALTLCTAPCHAQFGTLINIYKGNKAAKQAQKAEKKARDDRGNKKIRDIHNNYPIDTTSVEYKQAKAEAMEKFYANNPRYKKMMELKDDSVAMRKYMEEQYGGLSQEEIVRKALEGSGVDYNSKEFQDAFARTQKMAGLSEDSVYRKVMDEKRQLTREEANYLNEKYGTSFESPEMDEFRDSIGVFAHLEGGMMPMRITKYVAITEERPIPDFGQDEIKQYVKDYITFLKNPLTDREIVDSVQNYLIYNHSHADEQFKGTAKFTIYSNLNNDASEITLNDFQQRKIIDFLQPIDPNNILIFKVHKGIGCRFMEYMYSKISYKQSELSDYICRRLIDDGYIDASIEQKISDEQLFKAIDKMEYQFKLGKLLEVRQNNEKFIYTNTIPAAKNVIVNTNVRKIGLVTALDVSIDAKPGEYAFIIRKPDVEEYLKHIGDNEKDEKKRKRLQNFDIPILAEGAFFFTIK